MWWKGWGVRGGEKVTDTFYTRATSEDVARDEIRERIAERFDNQGVIAVVVEKGDPKADQALGEIVGRGYQVSKGRHGENSFRTIPRS